MKLPFISYGKKKLETSYFLSLILRDEQISAYILKETQGQLHIIGRNEEILDKSIEQLDIKGWIETLDRVISNAERALPQNVLTRKTMFGVKENWVEENKIKKEYLHKLKQICDELGLQPTGFLVISEAISHQLQEEEGAPLTAILVEIGKNQMTVSHIRAGRILETKHTIIIDSAVKTLDALLKHFITATVLPSRIILFDGSNTESLSQEFISHQWSKSLPFLHMPQIIPLPHGFEARAVILGAAEQMGLQVSNDINMAALSEKIVPITAVIPSPEPLHASTTDEEKTIENLNEESGLTSAQEFQKRLDERLSQNAVEEAQIASSTASANEFGFIRDADISTISPKVEEAKINFAEDTEVPLFAPEIAFPQDGTHESFHEEVDSSNKKKVSKLAAITSFLPKFKTMVSKLLSRDPNGSERISHWMFVIPVILLIIVGAIVWYIFNVKADIQLTLKPKIAQEQGSITFALGSGNDFANNTVAAKDVSVDLTGSSTTNATGSKDVGTPAKGTVTIYNSSNSSQTLSSGTSITSSNNLTFTLDKDVNVSSASGDIFSGTKPGTADVSVTAKDIGTQYNLPSNMTFSISGGNSVAAKNSNAFSGGSKKTVTVVSQKDINELLNALPQSLNDKAKSQLQTKISGDETLLPDIVSQVISSKSFNHNLNDQATSVTLNATVTFHGAAYNNQDVQDLAKILLKDKFTDNSSLSDKGVNVSISNEKPSSDGNTITANLNLQAGLLPHIDTKTAITQITGKTISQATNMLENMPQVESIMIKLHPQIPLIPQILPRFSNHITIEINGNG